MFAIWQENGFSLPHLFLVLKVGSTSKELFMFRPMVLVVAGVCWVCCGGCSSVYKVRVVVPATEVLPSDITDLAIVSKEKGEDANILLHNVAVKLNQTRWFKIRDTARGQLVFDRESVGMTKRVAQGICTAAESDAILVLESLSSNKGRYLVTRTRTSGRSNSLVTGSTIATKTVSSATSVGAVRSKIETATLQWAVYDCRATVLLTMQLRAQGNGGPPMPVLIRDTVGYLYPQSGWETRRLYLGRGMNFEDALGHRQRKEFKAAAEKWYRLAKISVGVKRAKALHNVAVTLELAGECEKALRIALQIEDEGISLLGSQELVSALQNHCLNADEVKEQEAVRAK